MKRSGGMRLEKDKINFLKQEIKRYLPDFKLYLFGSRVDDKKKGGDIDLLILSNHLLKRKNKRDIKIAFYNSFGEQKLDLVYFSTDSPDPFKELVLMEGVEL
jgi:predicted nucleotidyltransferase